MKTYGIKETCAKLGISLATFKHHRYVSGVLVGLGMVNAGKLKLTASDIKEAKKRLERVPPPGHRLKGFKTHHARRAEAVRLRDGGATLVTIMRQLRYSSLPAVSRAITQQRAFTTQRQPSKPPKS